MVFNLVEKKKKSQQFFYAIEYLGNWGTTYSGQEHHLSLSDLPPLSVVTEFLAHLASAVIMNGA